MLQNDYPVLTLADVRIAIASFIGDTKSSFTHLLMCPHKLRIVTKTANDSVELINNLKATPGELFFFQAYNLDGYGPEGSTFIIGGSFNFMLKLINQLDFKLVCSTSIS